MFRGGDRDAEVLCVNGRSPSPDSGFEQEGLEQDHGLVIVLERRESSGAAVGLAAQDDHFICGIVGGGVRRFGLYDPEAVVLAQVMEQRFVFVASRQGDKSDGVCSLGLHGRNRVFGDRIMPLSICLIAAQIGSQTIVGQVHIHAFVNERGRGFQAQARSFRQGVVRLAGSQNLGGVQRLKIRGGAGETAVPCVMVVGGVCLRFRLVGVLAAETDVIAHVVDAIGGGEAEIIAVGIACVVIHPHRAAVVVLVKPACVVGYREAVMDEDFMVRIFTSHLKAVAVALTGIAVKGDGDGLTISVNHLRTHFGVKPRFVHS